ncbi:glycosyltransferase [Erysipelothrix sp. HDW6B]|uniref:glycosyltransferase n=1 Tax=Erysipelothrix sp. HDW6B TaxID=2714929 RepID=UPI00140BCEF4|nr:glycosyltransferase [Erysipelothrix sp. HDW6B]QIK86861.1 glycosyltransferase [Erysipelothrix sp. HDW6B]
MNDRKININYYVYTLGGGGAEKALLNLVHNMDKDKFNVTVTTIINTGKYIDELGDEIKHKSVIHIPKIFLKKFVNNTGTLQKDSGQMNTSKEKNDTKMSFAVRVYTFFWKYFSWLLIPIGFFQNIKNDVIVSYLEGPTQIFVSSIPLKRIKIAWIHVDLNAERKSEVFFRNMKQNRNTYKKFDQVIAVSNGVKKSLEDYMKIDTTIPISVKYNVYDESQIKSLAQTGVNANVCSDKLNIISVGRLSKQKGYDRLIEAVSMLDANLLNKFTIRIYGDGEEKESLSSMIIERGLSGVIRLEGFTDNPYFEIANSDLFIAPSRTEGFSTVVVESVIIGTPVLATDCSGMDEILNYGEYGCLVENSVNGVYNGIFQLVSDKDKMEQISKSILNAENIFNKKDLTALTEQMIYSLINKKSN